MNNIVKEIIIFIIVIVSFVVTFKLISYSNTKKNIEIFNNGGFLDCGVIVHNEKWRLVDTNLVNNELAGHLNIRNCKGIK